MSDGLPESKAGEEGKSDVSFESEADEEGMSDGLSEPEAGEEGKSNVSSESEADEEGVADFCASIFSAANKESRSNSSV